MSANETEFTITGDVKPEGEWRTYGFMGSADGVSNPRSKNVVIEQFLHETPAQQVHQADGNRPSVDSCFRIFSVKWGTSINK